MRRVLALLTATALASCGGDGDTPRPASTPAAAGRPVEAAAGEPAARWPRPERYSLELAYDERRYELAGTQTIALRNTGPAPLASVWLRTWGNAFGGCAHRYVRVRVTGGGRGGAERLRCTALKVRLESPLEPGASTALELRIRVTAPKRPDRFGRFAGAAFFGNALPLLAVADADGWNLPPYTFRGESFFSLSSPWNVRLRLPPGVRAAMTGSTVAGVTTAVARDFAIVAGPLELTERRAGGVMLRHWRLREPAADARRVLLLAAAALRSYARWFGPYGREELDLVEGPSEVARGAGIGMEYPELVLTPAQALVVRHEVAHQWWYGIVGNDEYAQPWLDESFATYSGVRLAGGTGGCEPPRGRPRLTASMRVFERAHRSAYSRVVYVGGSVRAEHARAAARPRPLRPDAARRRARTPRRDPHDRGVRRGGPRRGAAGHRRRRAAPPRGDRPPDDHDAARGPSATALRLPDGSATFLREWLLPGDAERRGSILLVHGLGEHSGRYGHVAERLSALGLEVRGYDLRGHGRSDGARGSIPRADALLADLRFVFEDLDRRGRAQGDDAPPLLLGHSLGGTVAAMATAGGWVAPRALILSSPALALHGSRPQAAVIALARRLIPDRALPNRLPTDKLSHDAREVAAYRADPLVHDRITPRMYGFLADAGAAVRRKRRRG